MVVGLDFAMWRGQKFEVSAVLFALDSLEQLWSCRHLTADPLRED